jgi:hypothetical protein
VAPQSPHDALFRAAFEVPQHAAGLLRALLPSDLLGLVALDSLELQSGDGRGKQFEEFRTDLLFRAQIGGSPGFVCFLFEHQSSSDASMPLRVLGYLLRTWERYWRREPGAPLPPIVPIVISHDPRGWSAAREFSELLNPKVREHPSVRSVTPSFRYIIDDLSRLSDDELRARALGTFPTLVLWALRDARTPGQILATLDQWADALTDAANAAGGRDALQQLFVYISNVAENLAFDQFKAEVSKLGPAAQEAVMTIAEQLRAQGLKQGREEGRHEGRKEGRDEARRESLEELLALKFGPLPEDVATRIQAADSATVDRWFERVLTGGSLASILDG